MTAGPHRILCLCPRCARNMKKASDSVAVMPRDDAFVRLFRAVRARMLAVATLLDEQGFGWEEFATDVIEADKERYCALILEHEREADGLGQAALTRQIGEAVMTVLEEKKTMLVRAFIDTAYDSLSDEDKAELNRRMNAQIMKAVGGPIDSRVREAVLGFAADLAEELLAEREADIRARVAAEVEARWQAAVDQIVEARLAAAITRIKQEMAR